MTLLLLLNEVGSARLTESDINHISPKTPALQYQPIDRKKRKGKIVIIYHDFLPPPRSGSHVKSDYYYYYYYYYYWQPSTTLQNSTPKVAGQNPGSIPQEAIYYGTLARTS